MLRVRVLETSDSVAELAATAIARLLNNGNNTTLGLAGGSTPAATYTRLREEDVEWERIDAWLGDERWVPPDDADRNERMIRKTLMKGIPARLHGVPWQQSTRPGTAARRYSRTLGRIFRPHEGRPDVVLLGLGADGHTASLFPGGAALEEERSRFVAEWISEKDQWRLTASIPLLRSARHQIFLVTGSGKAEALARTLEGNRDTPASLVMEAESVTVFADEAAAHRLETTEIERP